MANKTSATQAYTFDEYVERFGRASSGTDQPDEEDFADELAEKTLKLFESALSECH